MRREGSTDGADPPLDSAAEAKLEVKLEVKLSLEPEDLVQRDTPVKDLVAKTPSLRLDRDELASIANTKEWSEEAKACLVEYRTKVESGNEDAFPLWRKEQLQSPDPNKKKTVEEINAAIAEEARKERTRARAQSGNDAGDANATTTATPDADEDEACTLEETLPGGLTGATEKSQAAAAAVNTVDDPFLAAAASAAAAHKGKRNVRSLMLGRKWYDSALYPTPGAKPADAAKTETTTSEGDASRGTSTMEGGGSRPPRNEGDSGEFKRPPKLILFPDGSMREVSTGAGVSNAAEEDGLTRTDSGPTAATRDSANGENMQYQLPASHRGGPHQVRIAPTPPGQMQQQQQYWYQRQAAAQYHQASQAPPPHGGHHPHRAYGWPPGPPPPTPYPPAQPNPAQQAHAWNNYQAMASQQAMMGWMNAMWMNAVAAINAQQAQEEAPGAKKGKAVTFAHPSGSDGSDGGSGGSGESGGSGPSGGSGGSGGTRGSGSSGQPSTHKLEDGNGKAKFRPPSVSSDDTRLAPKAVPTKGARSKRPNPNDKKAFGSPSKRKRTGKVMSDAADCLQLLSEGVR